MTPSQLFKFATICIVGSILFLALLYAFMDKPNEQTNGFHREFSSTEAVLESTLHLKYDGYYLVGNTENHIYIGNISVPSYILSTGINATDTQSISVKIPTTEKWAWKSARMSVDSPFVYITEGITPKLFIGNLTDKEMVPFMKRSSYFTHSLNISPTSFAVRSVTAKTRENILMKISLDSPFLEKNPEALQKQVDGLFCTDGWLKYDKQTGGIVYLYAYRNEYIALDTNLNIQFRANTIDTNTTAKITIANTTDKGNYIFSSPPTFVNAGCDIYEGRLYILSALRADNEKKTSFRKNNTIDVYSIKQKKYLGSIYIPRYNGQSIREFIVLNRRIVALYEHYLCIYNITA